jgi:hypothetical protein
MIGGLVGAFGFGVVAFRDSEIAIEREQIGNEPRNRR